ncbi:MAG: methionine synthase [Alphaproteobacteria bacterium]|nr:methionine synthase [Alphaproteobacteria bacterium]
MSDLLAALRARVLLCDGATGSRVQAMTLDTARDFDGRENCTEVLNLTRPDIVREIHRGYLAAGADVVQTNSFGGSPLTLAEFDLAPRAAEINRRAAQLAREALAEFAGDGRTRFVLGAIGPGTRLPSLGHVGYDTIEAALAVQAEGLIAGGVDGVLIETCQDPLQIKAAINATKLARAKLKRPALPILVQVTIETTGTLLVGTDIAAAATIVQAMGVDAIGLNCATGPQEMAEHVKWLAENWPGTISVQPNAGLPELVEGRTHYPLGPDEIAKWLERFVREDGVGLIGGCCGTTPAHIAALDAMLKRLGGGDHRPAPKPREVRWTPSLASLYQQVPLAQENAFFAVGERCNANGSKAFREAQAREDWDACVAIGREQIREGSHALDLCTAFVGRDEVRDMSEAMSRLRGAANMPLMVDSTELPVLEAALKLYGGKAVLNSINFESGEEPAEKRMELARRFGAAVVALTIDETGMAKDVDSKVAIAKRLADFACGRFGLPQADLMIDPLTFTICTGNEDDRKLGLWTLEAIERIRRELPEAQLLLGLSNISFGLKPAARHVLNSVFLDHAVKRGMTAAIVHPSKLMPLHKIPPAEVKAAEDLIFDRRAPGFDPLHAFIALFGDRAAQGAAAKARPESIEDRLKQRIVDGDRKGLGAELDQAMARYAPLDIVNSILLDGMKTVGELFGSGKMQLPFVLQSAETMKAAVAHLEPHMERIEGQAKGTIVLATVKGDVHDIGKNLVDIILTNNGYRVVNLGIKQPIGNILDAAAEHKADAIGMSGLLVKSTVVMRENLEEMTRGQWRVPVFLGGAALTRKYVEEDCRRAYGPGRVAYARDAFDGLALMDKVVGGGFDAHVEEQGQKRAGRPGHSTRTLGQASAEALRPVDAEETRLRREELAKGVAVPTPPFWGARVVEQVAVDALVPFLNQVMLFQFQWGYRKGGKSLEEFKDYAKQDLRPVLKRMLELCKAEDILRPAAVYGYWKAAGSGNDLILYETDGKTEAARFALPRQPRPGGLCIADFLRDASAPERDVIGLQVVTMGRKASDVARAWFAENRYRDYLYLHGLSVEMAEALAEHTHKRIRGELGFSHEDDRDMARMLRQGYRGSRYSFGYPACPNLADQRALLKLLGAERIGVSLTEEDQLEPEQSTSAIVLHHPQAKYFSL